MFLQDVSYTNLIVAGSRSRIETGGWSHHDGFALVVEFLQTPAAELFRIIDRQFGYGIEGSHRNRRVYARNTVQAVYQALTALYILIVYVAVVLFRSIQRSFGYNLTDQWRRETGLAELHHRLADFCILGDEGTHTDTALTVTLRNRIDENRVLLDAFQVHRTDIRTAGIDILTVNLIREEIEVVLLHQVTNLIHLSAGIEIARRVVRVADQNGTGALIDKLLKLLYLRQGETFFYRCGDGTDLGTRRDGKRHIVSVSRFWYDNLVARVEAAHEREEYSLRTSRCNDDIIGSYVDVEFLIVIYKLLAIAEIALTWRILQDRAVYMLQGI